MSKRPDISAPMLARRSEISSSPSAAAPLRIRPRVSDAVPDVSALSRLAPAGKSTARSSIGRSWVSTNNTRAPLVVRHCCIGKMAPAADAATMQASARTPFKHRALALVTSDSFRVWTRALAAGQGLRIKHRHGEVVVDKVFARHFPHLLGGDFLQFLHLLIRRVERQPDGLPDSDRHGLIVD